MTSKWLLQKSIQKHLTCNNVEFPCSHSISFLELRAHVSAADVFVVCRWLLVIVPNDPTHTSSEETALTERVPAEPFPISSQL